MGHIYADHSSAAFSQGERFIDCQVVLRIDQGKENNAVKIIFYDCKPHLLFRVCRLRG